jgi:orotidine-5'-phosphate decarboxylase
MRPKDKLIFALDVSSREEALRLAGLVGPHVGYLKVGMELFYSCGPEIVQRLREHCPIFLDLKLHDIPETVARSAAAVAQLSPSILTVHACDGEELLQAAVKNAPNTKIAAITVLTSVPQTASTESLVLERARWAANVGCGFVVASGREASAIKENKLAIQVITPGIRPSGGDTHDQKRVVTPTQAIKSGADLLVVGRPIRDAKDPVYAAQQIVEEIERAQK